MRRYFVVLPEPVLGPIIIAEVVRERGDDGRLRSLSLAANLAGPNAAILTREELAGTDAGRAALRRWTGGDDRAFDLDTLRMELGLTQRPADPSSRTDLTTTTVMRAEELRREAGARRTELERSRIRLQRLIELQREARQACARTMLEVNRTRVEATGRGTRRRWLRSVS